MMPAGPRIKAMREPGLRGQRTNGDLDAASMPAQAATPPSCSLLDYDLPVHPRVWCHPPRRAVNANVGNETLSGIENAFSHARSAGEVAAALVPAASRPVPLLPVHRPIRPRDRAGF
jgi:hypothetical protein